MAWNWAYTGKQEVYLPVILTVGSRHHLMASLQTRSAFVNVIASFHFDKNRTAWSKNDVT